MPRGYIRGYIHGATYTFDREGYKIYREKLEEMAAAFPR